MVGKRHAPNAPAWFKPDAYSAAETLDAGDWLLNLALRSWLARESQPGTEAALRSVGPVLRRGDPMQIEAMHLADRHRWLDRITWSLDSPAGPAPALDLLGRPSLPDDVREALRHGAVKSGIWPLGLTEMYLFERKLPDDVRAAAAKHRPNAVIPRELEGNLDDAFGPAPARQLTERFVRVDLKLPDDVLHADFQRYLKRERARLAAMGGQQPYREAARLKVKAHDLRRLASLGLLQFLDVDRWQHAEGLALSAYAVCVAAGLNPARARELQRRAAETCDQLKLHAWFARLERSMAAPTLRPGRRQ